MDQESLQKIADWAQLLQNGYEGAAADYKRNPSADNTQVCVAFTTMLGRLAQAVAKYFPQLWPELRLVARGAIWHADRAFDWPAGILELRRIEAVALEAADRPEVPQEPKNYLLNWREVLAAIGRKNTAEDRRQVSRINEETGGPISVPKRGSQPKVERGALLIWWNRLEIQWADAANQAAGERIDADAQYHYGQSGEVAPGIGGGVKRRRSDRKP